MNANAPKTKPQHRLARRIARRLRDEHGVKITPEVCTLHRTYAGMWQQQEGAWLWEMDHQSQLCVAIGSRYTATECAQSPHLSILRMGRVLLWEIFPAHHTEPDPAGIMNRHAQATRRIEQ